jgi:hypothetical protein
MKMTLSKMKSSLEGINSILDNAEEKNSDFFFKNIIEPSKIIDQERKVWGKKNPESSSLTVLNWGMHKCSYMHTCNLSPRGREKRNRKQFFEGIMVSPA